MFLLDKILVDSFPTFIIVFDAAGQRVFTANEFNDSISIIDLSQITLLQM